MKKNRLTIQQKTNAPTLNRETLRQLDASIERLPNECLDSRTEA